MADPRGKCRAPVGPAGSLDGCQEFEPQDDDPKLCDNCGCKRGFHEKLTASVVPEVQTVFSDTLSELGPRSGAAASLGKQARVSAEGAQSSEDVPAVKKPKLEVGEGSTDLLVKQEGKQPVPPATLQKNFNACRDKFPADEYGEFHLVKKPNGAWCVQCVPCKQLMAIQSNNTLSNFERHHVGEAKHRKNVEAQRNAARSAEKAVAGKEQKLREKREELVNKYAGQGPAFVDQENWRCTVCSFAGKFGLGDTIKRHVEGADHLKAKEAGDRAAGNGPVGKQASLTAVWAKGVQQGTVAYPPFYVPQPGDICGQKMRQYVSGQRCHGFWSDEVKYGSEVVSVAALKCDLQSGGEWYPDPHYRQSLVHNGIPVEVQGTFRHFACEGHMCSKCPLIPRLADFKARALREAQSEFPRGTRVCQQGVRLDMLQRVELEGTAREWQRRFEEVSDQKFLLSVKVLHLTKARVQLKDKLETASMSGSLPELAESFRRACDTGAFEGRTPLLNFLLDLGKNVNAVHAREGRGQGKSYHASTKLMFETVARFGGPAVHRFVSDNLLGPALNTSLAQYRLHAFQYSGVLDEAAFEHIAKVLAEHKARLGITGPVPIECSEDETACIRLATWNRRKDTIEGFCGKLSSADGSHKCSFDCGPSAATFDSIKQAFADLKVGTMCRLILLNPLATGMPKLVYALLPTCNTFNAGQVYAQWKLVRAWHVKHVLEKGGPLIAHASDGDKKRVKCMVESLGRGVYGLDKPSFVMRAEVVGGMPLLMDQDSLHCAKKMRNPLLNATRDIFWGQHMATKNHLKLVIQVFPKEEHGLLEEDVDVRDKQNFPAVQRIAFPRVRGCLQKLQEGHIRADGQFFQEDCRGTAAHLEVICSYLEVFFGRGTLWERVLHASFVVHMLFLGSAYIRNRGLGHTLKRNWLTREGQLDTLISCHAAVNLIRLGRDFFPHLPVALDRFGTDCCEDMFSLLGQQVKNKHNFTFGEALERISHISRTAVIKVDRNSPVFASSRRRKNIWWSGGAATALPNLADYGSATDAALEAAWSEGETKARERAVNLGMEATLQASGKWDAPWPSFAGAVEQTTQMRGEDEDEAETSASTAAQSSASTGARAPASVPSSPPPGPSPDDSFDDSLDSLTVRSAVLDAAQELDEEGAQGVEARSVPRAGKVSAVVDVPGKGPVYKMRLITELNQADGDLPLDRLRRVQVHEGSQRGGNGAGGPEEAGLFDNVAVYFLEGADNHEWYLGRVQKMFKQLPGGRKVDYVLPVPLGADADPGVHLLLKYYKHVSGLKYGYGGHEEEGEADPISLGAVIGLAKLQFDAESACFTLDESDRKAFDLFVDNERQTLQTRQARRTGVGVRQRREESSLAVAGASVDRVQVTTRTGRVASAVARR